MEPQALWKILDHFLEVLVDPLVRVTSAKFWMKPEGHSHNGSVESGPPVCENLVHLSTTPEHQD